MPAPSKSYTNVPDSKIDTDSPMTEELWTWIRDNIINLRERLGIGSAELTDHKHRGLTVDGTAPVDTLVAFPFLVGLDPTTQLTISNSTSVWMVDGFKRQMWVPPGVTKIVVPLYFVSTGTATPRAQVRLQAVGIGGGTTDTGSGVSAVGSSPTVASPEVTLSASNLGRKIYLSVQGLSGGNDVGKIQRCATVASIDYTTDQLLNAHFE